VLKYENQLQFQVLLLGFISPSNFLLKQKTLPEFEKKKIINPSRV